MGFPGLMITWSRESRPWLSGQTQPWKLLDKGSETSWKYKIRALFVQGKATPSQRPIYAKLGPGYLFRKGDHRPNFHALDLGFFDGLLDRIERERPPF